MHSLFWRIFLWSWLVMAAVVAVLVVTSPLLTRSRPGLEDWRSEAEGWARSAVERAAVRLEAGEVDGPPHGRGQGRGRGDRPPAPARVFILDTDGRELHGDEAPPEVVEIARRALAGDAELAERAGALHLVARPVETPDGRRLAVVAAHHRPPRLVHLLEPRALAVRLGILLLVVGGLSLVLARALSAPIAPLRDATRRLSAGDLSARVGGAAGRRRDEIGELARDFDAMAERIERLVESRERLLRDVSHELRSPLARLGVALELVRAAAGAEAAANLDRMERDLGRLDELIARLLLLERLDAAPQGGEAAEVDLEPLVAEVVADARFETAGDGREVGLSAQGDCRVMGRPEPLRSAFDNIIRNALQHTPSGTAVRVGLRRRDDRVEVVVRDHGAGVPEAELERVFEAFHRVDESRDRASGGVGLGLAIAARAVGRHGGTLVARNHPEGGLEVTASLPAADG
jgi:two-component system sensor histidine kinase CpxA